MQADMDVRRMTQVAFYWLYFGHVCLGSLSSTRSKSLSLLECASGNSCCVINDTAVFFNPTQHVCCGGELKGRRNDGSLYCCGKQLYFPSQSICCGSALHGINATNTRPSCCGTVSFDASRFICCAGVVRTRRFRNTACCGVETMDATKNTCCQEKVQPSTEGRTVCCATVSYNPHKDTCCDRVISKDIVSKSCCGARAYYRDSSTCCSQHLDHKPGLQCCQGKAYDHTTHTCCGGRVQGRNDTRQGCCCKGRRDCTSFDEITNFCCGGKIIPKQNHLACCGTDVYDVTMQACCGNIPLGAQTPSNWHCCGSVVSNHDNQVCCENHIHPRKSRQTRCCGNQAYEPSKQQCEDSLYSHVILLQGEYCLDLIYNPDIELCCSGKIVPKRYRWLSACCNQTVFDREKQICCRGIVSSLPAGIPQCCGDTALNIITQRCDVTTWDIIIRAKPHVRYCGTKKLEYDYRKHRCCNGSIYDAGQTCCQGRIKSLPGIGLGQGKCCADQPYNNNSYICCHGNLSSKDQGTQCCGNVGYNTTTHACCDGKVYPEGFTCCEGVVYPTPRVELRGGKCCAGIGYDNKDQICCGDKIFPKTSSEIKCCGGRPYDWSRNSHICCHATLSLRHSNQTTCCRKKAFDPNLEMCCRGFIHLKQNASCCGRNAFHLLTETCCEKNVYPTARYGNSCCSKMAYNTLTHMCRSGTVTSKSLCARSVYNNRTHTCCAGKLHTRVNNHECCNRRSYNVHESICCGNRVRPITKVCCGGRAYSARVYQCCGDVAIKRGSYSACCAGRVYEHKTYRCARRKIVVKGKLRRMLCGKNNVAFLGNLTSIGKTFQSLSVMSVFMQRDQSLTVNSKMNVSLDETSLRSRVVLQLGSSYLVIGELGSHPFTIKHTTFFRPWNQKLQRKLETSMKVCKQVHDQLYLYASRKHTYSKARGMV